MVVARELLAGGLLAGGVLDSICIRLRCHNTGGTLAWCNNCHPALSAQALQRRAGEKNYPQRLVLST